MALTCLNELEQQLLDSIVEICEFAEPIPDHMTSDSPLIGPDSPLGLDSLDAIEILTMIQLDYGVRITSRETSIEVLNSLNSIADYIQTHRDKA